MKNETVTLSRELVGNLRALVARNNTSSWSSDMLGKIDVALSHTAPPAMPESEVQWQYHSRGTYGRWVNISPEGAQGAVAEGFQVRELVDRAHVIRLQAEVERLKSQLSDSDHCYRQAHDTGIELMRERDELQSEVERLKSESFEELYNTVIDERDALQDELTKALELLNKHQWEWQPPGPNGEDDGYNCIECGANELDGHKSGCALNAALAHQSAPAAKDGE
ncbi:hypothetical protein FBY06_11837 [Pseudomonas sp. SJZ085]|uniref:hypothetical protein n=1 Tax=unclassified Pseudomonas TaxID=196821 RepID=UPI00119C5D3A|nr:MULTISPECIES: hypothetical protein [unclassified Pseudomonas]TWC17115.1 hypothetical protein FBX99_118107 [Pseudomonas sp. SJZ074]TWC35131.1 hypothetical protein FBY06_11837 [Pseudomonas sp. SJZ085]